MFSKLQEHSTKPLSVVRDLLIFALDRICKSASNPKYASLNSLSFSLIVAFIASVCVSVFQLNASAQIISYPKFTLRSSAFNNGGKIPNRYTGFSEDFSPPIFWLGVPSETKQLALIMEDPDAPSPEPWVHWVVYALPPVLSSLDEARPASKTLGGSPPIYQGKNSWNTIGYRGPFPPPGKPHRYYFTLYALRQPIAEFPNLGKKELLKAMDGKILAQTQLMGIFQK